MLNLNEDGDCVEWFDPLVHNQRMPKEKERSKIVTIVMLTWNM